MIKSKTDIFWILLASIFSLFVLFSCGSVPKQEYLPPAQEEKSPETEAELNAAKEPEGAEESEVTEKSEWTEDEKVENKTVAEEETVLLEKISEDELLINTETNGKTSSPENQDSFIEPEVQDSPFEEQLPEEKPEKVPEEQTENTELPQETVSEITAAPDNQEETPLEPLFFETKQETEIEPETEPAKEPETETAASFQPPVQTEPAGNNEDQDTSLLPAIEQQNEDQTPALDSKAPSRSMTVKNSQYVDVVYPGQGWIYMGEEGNTLFRYFGKKIGTQDTTVTLRSIKSGKTLLHFYKNDVLTGEYIDDYLEAEVLEENANPNERAKAPPYAEAVPPKPVRSAPQNSLNSEAEKNAGTTSLILENAAISSGEALSSSPKTTESGSQIQTPAKLNPANEVPKETKESSAPKKTISSKNLLEQAKKDYSDKNYATALSEIQSYLDTQNEKIDEALFVQGQILEADSEVKNIKSAIDSYNTLIKRYPASPFWQEANRRKIYLNRYYVNIY